ncbi:MAG TPA: hypothetical protein PK253_12500, partial [Spirochaetota bacterium]|nr:hypothetical protein [Spirochaetota bacterium]
FPDSGKPMDDERLSNVITYLEIINHNLTQIVSLSGQDETVKKLVQESKELVSQSLEHLHGEEIKKEIENLSSLE